MRTRTPEAARLVILGGLIGHMITRREAELDMLRSERDDIIRTLDLIPGVTSRDIGEIVGISHVQVRKIINRGKPEIPVGLT